MKKRACLSRLPLLRYPAPLFLSTSTFLLLNFLWGSNNKAAALFGFGGSTNSAAEARTAAAKARAVDQIRATAAADGFIPPAAGVGRRNAARYAEARASGKLACWGAGGATVEVDWAMVNDDFCDCDDGQDEPGTSACPKGIFECLNRGHLSRRLPSSRVGDGVCDCCDGSDETDGRCEAYCGQASEAWVERLAEKLVKAELGSERRQEYVRQAQEAVQGRASLLQEAAREVEESRRELATGKVDLKTLESDEKDQQVAKLTEWEDAVRAKLVGSRVKDSPRRVTALAVALASADDATATLDKVTRQVLDGMKVEDVLEELSNDGKGVANDTLKGKKKHVPVVDDEDLEGRPVDEVPDLENDARNYADDLENDFDLGHYDSTMLDDDLYGDYRYDAYGGGDFYEEDDEEIMIDIETVIQDEIHGHSHDGREGVGDVPVPGLDSDMEGDAIHRISTGRQGAVGKEQGELEAAGSEDEDADMGPFKAPKQFQNFKYETAEAIEGRKRVKQLGDELRVRDKKLKALEEEASADFGEDGALWSLKDKCVTHTTGNYEYRVCLFKDAHQNEKKSKTSIGKWKGIERSTNTAPSFTTEYLFTGETLVFDRGQRCWNGPARSLRVSLACGPEDILSTVAEPETCAYTAVLETPAACVSGFREALLAEAGGGRVPAVEGDNQARREEGLLYGGNGDVFGDEL